MPPCCAVAQRQMAPGLGRPWWLPDAGSAGVSHTHRCNNFEPQRGRVVFALPGGPLPGQGFPRRLAMEQASNMPAGLAPHSSPTTSSAGQTAIICSQTIAQLHSNRHGCAQHLHAAPRTSCTCAAQDGLQGLGTQHGRGASAAQHKDSTGRGSAVCAAGGRGVKGYRRQK